MSRAYSALPMRLLLWLRTPKLNKAGTAPIYLRIQDRQTGARAEVSTDIRCEPARWQGGEKKIRGRDAATLLDNENLDTFKAHARRVANALQDEVRRNPALPLVTVTDVARALKPRLVAAEPLLTDLLLATIPHHSPRATTRATYAHAVKWLARWPGAQGLTLAGLTVEKAVAFTGWLAQQSPGASTKRAYLAQLTGLLATAAPTHPAVFHKLRRLLGAPTDPVRQPLPADWQQQLAALSLTRVQALARDAFLLAYYLHGCRIGNVLELQWAHVDHSQQRVRFTTHKRPVNLDIHLHPALSALLARYQGRCPVFVLPLLPPDYLSLSEVDQLHWRTRSVASLNKALGHICRHLGWPKLHPHLARHTFALKSYQKNGNDLRVPQQLLGHKDIATTAKYIASLNASQLDASAANAYD